MPWGGARGPKGRGFLCTLDTCLVFNTGLSETLEFCEMVFCASHYGASINAYTNGSDIDRSMCPDNLTRAFWSLVVSFCKLQQQRFYLDCAHADLGCSFSYML